MNALGWIGGILLGTCSLPELYRSYKTKKCELTWGFLLMWFFGELCILVPVLQQKLGMFLIFNYSFNIAIISVLIFYKARTK